jgi:hypothetical protein
MLWYTCLIKHAETLLRTKDCCTHSSSFKPVVLLKLYDNVRTHALSLLLCSAFVRVCILCLGHVSLGPMRERERDRGGSSRTRARALGVCVYIYIYIYIYIYVRARERALSCKQASQPEDCGIVSLVWDTIVISTILCPRRCILHAVQRVKG